MGLPNTADLEGVITTAEDVEDFAATGVDCLAPASGNMYGEHGPRGPDVDFARWSCPRMVLLTAATDQEATDWMLHARLSMDD